MLIAENPKVFIVQTVLHTNSSLNRLNPDACSLCLTQVGSGKLEFEKKLLSHQIET